MDLPRVRMWRDVDAEIDVVSVVGARVRVQVEGGEEPFRLLCAGAASVRPRCSSPAAAALLDLKRAAAALLPPQSVRSLLGASDFGRRIWFYHYVRPNLSETSRRFWDPREETLRLGLLEQGRLEQRIVTLRPLLQRLLGGEAATALDQPTPEARLRWLDGWSRRARVRLGLGGLALHLGVGPRELLDRARRVVTVAPLSHNPFWSWALSGDAAAGIDYTWLEAGALSAILADLPRIEEADAPFAGPFDVVLLGTTAPTAADVTALRPGGRLVGWGTHVLPEGLARLPAESTRLTQADRSGLWGPGWVAERR